MAELKPRRPNGAQAATTGGAAGGASPCFSISSSFLISDIAAHFVDEMCGGLKVLPKMRDPDASISNQRVVVLPPLVYELAFHLFPAPST